MIYVVSQSTGDGALPINVVFKPGTNIDQAQVLVQNRVSIALPRLPEEVQRIGVTVQQEVARPDAGDPSDLAGRHARSAVHFQLRDHQHQGRHHPHRRRRRYHRVRRARLFHADLARSGQGAGARPDRRATWSRRCAPPTCRSPPAPSTSRRRNRRAAFEVAVQTLGRLSSPEQFSDIVVATDPDGRVTRVRDIAPRRARRRRLHDQRLSRRQGRDRDRHLPAAGLERAGDREARVLATMDELAKSFPPGLELPRRLQHHRVRPAIGRRGDQDAVRGGRAGRASSSSCSCRPGAPRSSPSSRSRCR